MKLPEVNFHIKPADSNGKSLIYLQFLFNKQRLFYSFGQKVNPEDWSKKKQRVKNKMQTTEDGMYLMNDLLNELAKECETVYKDMISKRQVPTPEALREALDKFRN